MLNLTTRFGDLDLAFSPSGFDAGFDALRPAATATRVAGPGHLTTSSSQSKTRWWNNISAPMWQCSSAPFSALNANNCFSQVSAS